MDTDKTKGGRTPMADNTAIAVMKRYEIKYLMNRQQTEYLVKSIEGKLFPDCYGEATIASLYYDTPDSRLIRESLEKPAFKEKIRLRSYGRATEDSPVYLELKRKAQDTVYKRRVRSTVPAVTDFFENGGSFGEDDQINREIVYFRDFYKTLIPACLIVCERTAYYEENGDLRLTIDRNPRYRTERLSLTDDMDGQALLPEGWTILEVKVQGAMPLWLSEVLSEGKIYKTGFSKYGEAYRQQLMKKAC